MSHTYRPLLPAPAENTPLEREPNRPIGFGSSIGSSLPKRINIAAACEACRKRKSKCTAERPSCSICLDKGTTCIYQTLPTETHSRAQKRKLDDLQFKSDSYEELFVALRTRSEHETQQILRRIRSGHEIISVVKLIREGDLLLQLSLHPEIRFRYEFPYKRELPDVLRRERNPYLRSILYDRTLRHTSPSSVDLSDADTSARDMYLVPFLAVEFEDEKIAQVHASQWTTVACENSLMRVLLRIYFTHEFPFAPFFHKDLFLHDLVHRRERFCSSLLVNAVLAAAWHGYRPASDRADFWNTENTGYKFLAEAKRLREFEPDNPAEGTVKITTIQALGIISLISTANGNDTIGWKYMMDAINLAKSVDLFSTSSSSYLPEMQKVRALSAWHIFNWQALCCLQRFRTPILGEPPQHPLPDYSEASDFFGELNVRYPSAESTVPLHNGYTARAVSEFRVILNDIALVIFSQHKKKRSLGIGMALEFRLRLLRWYKNLPEPLSDYNIVLPSHLKLHMHYHVISVCLFVTFDGHYSEDFTENPQRIVADSKACFETLIRMYFQRHSFEAYDVMLIHFLPLLAFTTLQYLKEKEDKNNEEISGTLRSTLILCAKGLCDQGRNSFSFEAVFRLLRAEMSEEDAQLTSEFARLEEDGRNGLVASQVRSELPITTYNILDNPADHCIDALVKAWKQRRYEEEDVEMDGTTGPLEERPSV